MNMTALHGDLISIPFSPIWLADLECRLLARSYRPASVLGLSYALVPE